MYAIMSAAIAHVTTRECKDNEMKCECGENITTTSATVFSGCSKNLEYGVKIAADFMDSAENEKGVRQLVNLQNNEVGRNVSHFFSKATILTIVMQHYSSVSNLIVSKEFHFCYC